MKQVDKGTILLSTFFIQISLKLLCFMKDDVIA